MTKWFWGNLTDWTSHTVIDAQCIIQTKYRTPYDLKDEMEQQVQKMFQREVIGTSSSPWSAPAIFVQKKSGDGKPIFRLCLEFRALKAVTKFESYPLPRFDETISTLFGSKYFILLDCYRSFWQVNIKEEHKEWTAFTVPSCHYDFNSLPFDLSDSPSNFKRLIDVVLKNYNMAEEHSLLLENLLYRFDEANLQLHPGKCDFA